MWYHRFVTDFLTLAYVVGSRTKAPFSTLYQTRLSRMHHALAELTDETGRIPNIGDCDQGRAVEMTSTARADAWPTLSTGAFLLDVGVSKRRPLVPDEETCWMLGSELIEGRRRHLRRGVARRSQLSVGGNGWATISWRRPVRTELLFDTGPQGLARVAPHGHADALSFCLRVNGHDVVVDAGTYAYNLEKRWRDFFRGTRAHNTVLVDGVGQAQPSFPFRWRRPADAKVERVIGGEPFAYIRGSHNGYERLPDPVTHKRHVLAVRASCFVIVDELVAKARHRYESLVHFPPASHLELQKNVLRAQVADEASVLLVPLGPGASQLLVGENEPIHGWYSPSYGIKLPCPVFALEWQTQGRSIQGMVLVPSDIATGPSAEVSEVSLDVVQIQAGECGITVGMRAGEPGDWAVDGCRTDGDVIVVRRRHAALSAAAVNASYLEAGEDRLAYSNARPFVELVSSRH